MFKSLVLKSLTLIAVAAVPQFVAAQPQSMAVAYADLDLASPAGRATLDRRISQAVRTICGPMPIDFYERAARRTCMTSAQASAAAQTATKLARAARRVEVAQAR